VSTKITSLLRTSRPFVGRCKRGRLLVAALLLLATIMCPDITCSNHVGPSVVAHVTALMFEIIDIKVSFTIQSNSW